MVVPASPSRRASLLSGLRAEAVCADYLHARGFELLARNARAGKLEVDLVARQGPLVVLVEVRTRGPGSFVGALASIDARKRERLWRASERLWNGGLKALPGVERVRIDAAAVAWTGDGAVVEYVEGAIVGGFGGVARGAGRF